MARRPRIRARSFGAVLISNGRKSRKRRGSRKASRSTSFKKRYSRKRKGSSKRKRNGRAWRIGKGWVRKNNSRRKKGRKSFRKKSFRKRNPGKGRKYGKLRKKRFSLKRRGAKRGAYLSNGRKSRKGRGKSRRRMSFSFKRNGSDPLSGLQATASKLTSPIAKLADKVPFIGKPVGRAVMSLPFVAVGALGAEIPLQAAKALASLDMSNPVVDFLKGLPEEQYIALISVLSGGVIAGFNKSAGIAVGSGGIGAAWFCYRRKCALAAVGVQDPIDAIAEEAGEGPTSGLGAVLINGSSSGYGALAAAGQALGMGPAYTVGPQGYGAVIVGS